MTNNEQDADRASRAPAVRMLTEALQGLVDFHTKPAGVTVKLITEKELFSQAMADIDDREKKLVADAIAALVGVTASAEVTRMLTPEEIWSLWDENNSPGPQLMAAAIQRKFCAVNAGRTIPADGKIGGV